MSIVEGLKMELEHEAPITRKMLERVPTDKLDWRPHEKSMKLGMLASHIAEIPGWVAPTLNDSEWDASGYVLPNHPSTAAIVADYDKCVAEALGSMGGQSDESLMLPWALKMDGRTVFEMPRIVCFRNFILNHVVHHRAQLGVYLRLLGVPVPATYGPSADEQG